MKRGLVRKEQICEFISRIDQKFGKPATLFLTAEASQVLEGWRGYTDLLIYTAAVPGNDLSEIMAVANSVGDEMNINIEEEHPGDLIPLPEGFSERCRAIDWQEIAGTLPPLKHISAAHFDPYSIAYRYIARGSEPDYHLAMYYLEHGWVNKSEMDDRLERLLPEFSMKTIAQDPAEFRRKYKGLEQMWKALRPGVTHRHTTA